LTRAAPIAGVGLLVVFVAFFALSLLGQHQKNVIVPVGNIKELQPVPSATVHQQLSMLYPFGYTMDTVIPLINVHQADFWGPNGQAPWGWVWVGGAWLATGLGWALATLLVAGYTMLVRQQ
jgi:hypothetical protein